MSIASLIEDMLDARDEYKRIASDETSSSDTQREAFRKFQRAKHDIDEAFRGDRT